MGYRRGAELSALSMHGHEIRLCPIIMCMTLTKGYFRIFYGSVSYQVHRRRRRRHVGKRGQESWETVGPLTASLTASQNMFDIFWISYYRLSFRIKLFCVLLIPLRNSIHPEIRPYNQQCVGTTTDLRDHVYASNLIGQDDSVIPPFGYYVPRR
jgi:hypothetical protein